jgi:hypothetical protein
MVVTLRRMEDKIRALLDDLLATEDEQEQLRKIAEVRGALHEHIERVRARLGAFPTGQERRLKTNIQSKS